jgi:hypothetical protein
MRCCVACRIVDLHELKLRPAPGCTQGKTTDATKTVDTYFYTHVFVLLKQRPAGSYDVTMSDLLMPLIMTLGYCETITNLQMAR